MKISSIHPIIITDNTEKIMQFYAALGFTTKHAARTIMGNHFYVIANGDVELEIMETPENPPIPMPAGLYGLRLNVDDLDAACETFTQNGGTVLAGPLENEYEKAYMGKDAGENYITLMKHKRKQI